MTLNETGNVITKEKSRRNSANSAEEYRLVMDAVRDIVFRTHRFPSVSQVSEQCGIPVGRCKDLCSQLCRQKQLYEVFGGGKGLPTVVLPYDMFEAIRRTQPKPDWLSNPEFGFSEKPVLEQKLDEIKDKMRAYEMYERLLYATDIPLEEAVAFALEVIGFRNVVHHKDDPDNADVTFEHNGKHILVEVEGTTKAGDKRKVLQLDGWMRREIETKGRTRAQLQGLFIVNHFRESKPNERGSPLTDHAKEFLKHYGFQFMTTLSMFELLRDCEQEKLEKEKARETILVGESIA